MNKQPLKLAFVDFWDGFHLTETFLNFFRAHYDVSIDEDSPDVVVYSCFGTQHQRYPHALRIFFTGENVKPDFNTCDYSFGTIKIDYRNKNLWLPISELMLPQYLPEIPPVAPVLAKRKFCSFIYSQDTIGEGAILRRKFCELLMNSYAHVDCPGKVLHNLDTPEISGRYGTDWDTSKRRFLSNYKFNIAFENSAAPGYITEKLTDAYLGNTAPIYWGSDGDTTPYPKDSMICANDYPTLDALIARIKEVNENDELYLAMLAANPLRQENLHKRPDLLASVPNFLKTAIDNHISEHRDTRATHFSSLHQSFEEFKRHPYVRASMQLYRGAQKIKHLFGMKKS